MAPEGHCWHWHESGDYGDNTWDEYTAMIIMMCWQYNYTSRHDAGISACVSIPGAEEDMPHLRIAARGLRIFLRFYSAEEK